MSRFKTIAILAMLGLSIFFVCIQFFQVPTESMKPALQKNTRIMICKLICPVFHKGDVLVFQYPVNRKLYYVKRLIGVGGDEIEINDQQIKVNGKILPQVAAQEQISETYLYYKEQNNDVHYTIQFQKKPRNEKTPLTFSVPTDSLFVMGDNRDESIDSRTWGFVKNELVVGKVIYSF